MRIKKKFIHIGLHKTATTYLQNHIFNNIENFELVTRPFTQHNKAFNMMQYADDTINRLEKLFGKKINNKKKVQVNSSHSKRKIFLMRSFNKIDYFFQSKLIRKFLHLLINLIHPSFFKEVNSEDEIEKIIKNFFKKDNLKLKKIVKDVDWTKYPNHYRTDD